MASLTSPTVEGCEYEEKSSTDGGGSRKSSPAGPDDGEIELDSSGNSSPDTAAVDGNYEALASLQRYLPSNSDPDPDPDSDSEFSNLDPVDSFSCDQFRMFEFKVRRCARGRSHDWTDCPFAHPGDKARRRDPRKFHYSGSACPDFRKGHCKNGDACLFAHGVFECWLHPARYRTQPCKDGTSCKRRVCFFAHTPEQLRVLPQQHSPRGSTAVNESYDGSPLRQAMEAAKGMAFISPEISPDDSPPMMSRSLRSSSANERARFCRQYEILMDDLFRVRRLRRYYVREGIRAENESDITEHALHALYLGVTDFPRVVVEPANRETGHLIAGMRFGRGSADLTPTSPDFRLEIRDHVVEPEPEVAIMLEEQPRSRFNQAKIVVFVGLELSGTAFVIKYEESQMVAYFSMSTICYLSAMYTAHQLAPLEGGNERFSVYLRGSSFVFLGLLRFLGVNQGSFVTALKIILGMSQVVLYWWTSGILQTYMNAFGMRRN